MKVVDLGANVNIEFTFADRQGVSPLFYATAVQDAELVTLLLKSGKDT